MRKSLSRLSVAVVAAVLAVAAGVAVADDPPPTGPVFPLPEPTPGDIDGTGSAGTAGGATFTYADLGVERFDPLMWGVPSNGLPKLAMDGAIDEPGETMTWSAAGSDLAAGMLRFTGSAELTDAGPDTGVYDTRATVRTMTPGDEPLAMTPAADAELPPEIGGVAVIEGDFKSNLLVEVLDGSTWVPATDFFDAAQTDPQQPGDQLKLSIGGAFYYVPANELPEASLDWSPETPTAGRTVEFQSTSSDPDGEIVQTEWDLDGDGEFDDATGETASTVFAAAGDHEVGVRVTDDRGGVDTATGTVTVVPNEAPAASFGWSPQDPRALQSVTFSSTSTDSDGVIVETEWDLDGDGEFDDATGETASTTFSEGGDHTVGVRVTDDLGGVSTAAEVVTVRSCEQGPVSQTLRQVGALAGIEPTIRQLNCELLEPLGL